MAQMGDVFKVPVTDELAVVGQIVARRSQVLLVVIFAKAPEKDGGRVDDAIASGIALAGVVFDAKFRNGDWPIVDNRPPLPIVEPWFVVGHQQLGNLKLTNLDGSITRPAKPTETAEFDHLHLVYPMVLQMAAALIGTSSPGRRSTTTTSADWPERYPDTESGPVCGVGQLSSRPPHSGQREGHRGPKTVLHCHITTA